MAQKIYQHQTHCKIQKVAYGDFTLSGKAFATTVSGREIELQLSELTFWLRKKVIIPTIALSEAQQTAPLEVIDETPIWKSMWTIIAISIGGLLTIASIVYFIIRIKRKKTLAAENPEFSLDELTMTDLQSDSTKSK